MYVLVDACVGWPVSCNVKMCIGKKKPVSCNEK